MVEISGIMLSVVLGSMISPCFHTQPASPGLNIAVSDILESQWLENKATFLFLLCTSPGQHFRAGMTFSSFLGVSSGKEPTCKCRRRKRHGFNP